MAKVAPGSKGQTAQATRRRIITAAERICREVGPAGMSLDAVAAAAGVSKGGLLYHFPSKHALLRTLVEDRVSAFHALMERHAPGWRKAATPAEALRAAAAYLAAVGDLIRQTERATAGMYAALTEDPLFMAPLHDLRRELRRLFLRCPGDGLVIFLACEGVLHGQMIDPEGWRMDEAEADLRRIDRIYQRLLAEHA